MAQPSMAQPSMAQPLTVGIRASVFGDDGRVVRRLIRSLTVPGTSAEAAAEDRPLDGSEMIHQCPMIGYDIEWECWDFNKKALDCLPTPQVFWQSAAADPQAGTATLSAEPANSKVHLDRRAVAVVVADSIHAAVRWALGYREAGGSWPIVLAWYGSSELIPNAQQAMLSFAAVVQWFDAEPGSVEASTRGSAVSLKVWNAAAKAVLQKKEARKAQRKCVVQ